MSTTRAPRSLVLAAALVLWAAGPALAQHRHPITYETLNGRSVVAAEVIVKLRAGAGPGVRAQIEQAEDVDASETLGDGRHLLLHSRSRNTEALLRSLARHPDVEYVEPNWIVQMQLLPNDPHFDSLWALQNTGQIVNNHGGVAGADIDAVPAWDVTTGSRANVVAVIDSGVDYTHPDLAANVWAAPQAFSVTIGGVTVTCAAGTHGFNAIANTCDPMDDNNHGTHTSGTVGAVGNDGYGIVGVNWTASVMGIKFIDAGGLGTTANAINAIEFAIQARLALGAGANVRVLSNSWVLPGPSQALLDAITRAGASEMLAVFASGNAGQDLDTAPVYPQSYATASMINVAATNSADLLWAFSNVGATTVHLGAPGVDIVSTIRNGGYAFFNGTSMAAPHVAGVAALMLAVESTLSVAQLKAGILDHVDPLDTLAGVTVTGGRLNADAAVRWVVAQPNFRLDVTSAGAQTVTAGGATTYTLTVVPVNGFVDTVTFDLSGLPATATATFTPASVSGGGDVTLQVLTSPATPAGSYALTVTGGSGTLAHSAPLTLTVLPGTPDFRVTVAPASLQVSREGSAQATVTVETFAGWDKDVKVSVDGVPPHTKARLAPAMVDAPGTALLTIEAAKAAPAGRFTLTLTGRSAGGSRTAALELEVLP